MVPGVNFDKVRINGSLILLSDSVEYYYAIR